MKYSLDINQLAAANPLAILKHPVTKAVGVAISISHDGLKQWRFSALKALEFIQAEVNVFYDRAEAGMIPYPSPSQILRDFYELQLNP